MAIATNNLLYLHIPKTGGFWVEYIIKHATEYTEIFEVGERHTYFPQLFEFYNEDWYRQRYIFATIRHPITWYQSRWTFRMKTGWRFDNILDFNCMSNDFNVFVQNILEFKPNGWVTWLHDQFTNNVPGNITIVRLEYITNEIKRVLIEAGIKFDKNIITNTKPINDSYILNHSSTYWAKYTPELFDRVMAAEHSIITDYYGDYNINPNDHIG